MSIDTEPPSAEPAAADLDLALGEPDFDFGPPSPPASRAQRVLNRWVGPSPADRIARGLVVALGAGLAWLFLARPESWERFVALPIVAVAMLRIRLVRGWRPVAALMRTFDRVGRRVSQRNGIAGRAFVWWRRAPRSLKLSSFALLGLNAVIASALLHRNWIIFLAMACLNYLALLLAPPVDTTTEPEAVLRRPSPIESGAQDNHNGDVDCQRPAAGLLHLPTLRPFPTLRSPGWDSWDSWNSLKQAESTESRASVSPLRAIAEANANRFVHESAPMVALDELQTAEAADLETSPEAGAAAATDDSSRLNPLLHRLNWFAAITGLIVAVGWIAYAHPGPLLVAMTLAAGIALLLMNKVSREQGVRMVLGIGVTIAAIDYVSWRFVVTNWAGWFIAVPLLAAETLGAIHVLGFQLTLWPWRARETHDVEDPTLDPIFILIPTLNEGAEVLRPTIEACLAARDRYMERYAHARVRVIVCNDGRAAGFSEWREVEILARRLGAACVSRRHAGGAKAGNIEHARRCFRITRNSLLVIFDADQAPHPDFLLKTVPPFADPEVGWVQTGQYYANRDNPVSRWADDQQSLFYNLLCPGKEAHNAAFICGTNVVIRAAALDQIGGLPQDSVTEDFAASIALHPTWRSVYLTEVLATGLGPLDMPSYLKQQRRWAVGTMSVLRTNWRDIFLPSKGGLSGPQRVQYFLACTHYMSGIRDLVYLISPMLFIATGIPAVRSASLGQYLSHYLPYGILSYSALWYSARGVTGLRGIVMGFGSFPTLVGSFVAAMRGRKASFAVTAKRRHAKQSLTYLRVYLLCALACIATIVWATQVGARQHTSMFISLWWVVYTLLMLCAFLWLAVSDLRRHAAQSREAESSEVALKTPYPSKLEHRPIGLRPAGNVAAAVLLAAPLLLGGQLKSSGLFAGPAPQRFVLQVGAPGTPSAGVSIPAQLLNDQAQIVSTDLVGPPGVLGRTQDLTDHFPTGWARELAAQDGRPWITLQFGEFGPGGTVPLAATLPAIINGVDDQALARWAKEIRAYGKPVYLTILEHADRNWSVSSAVANGGIPEDVPKAWRHVQAVFRHNGANNVAWVWAPADPTQDQRFAPPQSSIDAILQSFINYPGTVWGQPAAVLDRLHERYPGKPVIIDVSVDGLPTAKAVWLSSLGQAIKADRYVNAVLYHEGGPELDPTLTQYKEWSASSDELSLGAWRNDIEGTRTSTSRVGDLDKNSTRTG